MTLRPSLFLAVAASLTFSTSGLSFASAAESAAVADTDLTVGDKAPQLDIEHWLQDGGGYFKPVKKFEDGKVYVVEFWATWCGPCRASMPLLAELQNKYRGQDVQIIGVSNENTDLIDKMMKQEHSEVGKTFGEISAAYSLTTDPDGSVYSDYMDASGSDGIPTAFIVGKKGLVEWIGSPFEMDEPLEKIVDGTWDLEEFKKEIEAKKQLQKNIEKVARLEEAGKYDEAIAFAAAQVKEVEDERISGYWNSIQHMLKLVSNKMDSETKDYFGQQFKVMQEEKNLQGVLQLSNELYSVNEMGGKIDPLGKQAIGVIKAIGTTDAPKQILPYYHNTLAHLYEVNGNFKEAVNQQEMAMSMLDTRQQKRMQPYLTELSEKAGEDEEE